MTPDSPKTSFSQKLTKALLDGGVIIALGTAVLYIMGRAVGLGLDSFWGLPSGYSTENIHETIYLGFLFFNLKSALFIIKIFFWVIGIYFLLHIALYLLYKFTDKLNELIDNTEPEKEYSERAEYYKEIKGVLDKRYALFSISLLFVLGIAAINGTFIKYGKENAQTTYESYKSLESKRYFINKDRKFYIVGGDEQSAALYFPDKDELEIVSRESLIGAKRPFGEPKEDKIVESDDASDIKK